jgi:hypothetical protein
LQLKSQLPDVPFLFVYFFWCIFSGFSFRYFDFAISVLVIRNANQQGPNIAEHAVCEFMVFELTQHLAQISIVEIWILVGQLLPFDFGPHHEGVHRPPYPRFFGHFLSLSTDFRHETSPSLREHGHSFRVTRPYVLVVESVRVVPIVRVDPLAHIAPHLLGLGQHLGQHLRRGDHVLVLVVVPRGQLVLGRQQGRRGAGRGQTVGVVVGSRGRRGRVVHYPETKRKNQKTPRN